MLPWHWSGKSLVVETVPTMLVNQTLRGSSDAKRATNICIWSPSTPRPQRLGCSAEDDEFTVIEIKIPLGTATVIFP